MSTEKIRIRIKAYDHRVLDNAAKKIVETNIVTAMNEFNAASVQKQDSEAKEILTTKE